MSQMSKLQIRAKVLSVLSEIKSDKNFNLQFLFKYVSILSDIDDKQTLLSIFLKEVIKMSEDEVAFSACIVKELLPKEMVEESVFEVLKNTSLSDESKYKLVQLLRVVGASSAINNVPQYFDNPQELIDLETEKMLKRASFNPETMLDFLDFIYAVSENDKKILLGSLKEDYVNDNLANLLYPILYSDFSEEIKKQVVEILQETKSALALAPFEYLLKVSDNKELISTVELGLKKLKFAGVKQEQADDYFFSISKDDKPLECYTTVVDGAGNQALLISRLNKDNNVNFVAIVINEFVGIVDCFGFYNISLEETSRVIAKFYKSEGKYNVSENYVKTKILDAMQTTIDNKGIFPYEFICWNTLLYPLQPLSKSIEQVVENLSPSNSVKKEQVLLVLTKEYTYRWFIASSDNLFINDAVEELYKLDSFDIKMINSILLEYVDKVFEEKQENIWKNRLRQVIYLLNENSLTSDAKLFLEFLRKPELFVLFKQIILQRSIYNNLLLLKENVKQSSLPINIFKKKIVSEEKYDIKKIEKLIAELEKCWINE